MSNQHSNTEMMPLAERENGGQLAKYRPQAAFGPRGIEIRQYDELVRFSQAVSESGLAPKGMEKPQAIFVAIQMGLELGLSPMASLQNVAVVNGRPTLWGDAQLAVCRGTGEMEVFEEWFEQGGKASPRNPVKYDDDTCAVCRVQRTGGQVIESAFSVADAKRANLWGKQGPWTQYPFRMLRNRARSFALRDAFGDALRGFRSTEEVMDMPEERTASGREVPLAQVPALLSGAEAAPAADEVPNNSRGDSAHDGQGRKSSSTSRRGTAGGAPDLVAVGRSPSDQSVPPVQLLWLRCEAESLDPDAVFAVLKEQMITQAEWPADLTDEEATQAMAPKVWPKLVELVRKGVAA